MNGIGDGDEDVTVHDEGDDVLLSSSCGIRKKANFFIARLVWQENEDKKKYHLVNRKTFCLPKEHDGLGILNLDLMNKALLAKWFWKLEN